MKTKKHSHERKQLEMLTVKENHLVRKLERAFIDARKNLVCVGQPYEVLKNCT